MPERKKIGARVDAALWDEFREDVERRHGQTRGVLSSELENAIRNYLYYGEDRTLTEQFAEFNQRLQRVEGAVGAAESDGGGDLSGASTHTRAPTETPTERPASNTATDKKIAWLAQCVHERHGDDFAEVKRDDLRQVVKDEYGFRRDTAKRYVGNLIDHFDLMQHPATDKVLVTDDRHEQIMENRREGLHKEAEEVLSPEGDDDDV